MGGALKESQAKKLFQQLVNTVLLCHNSGVLHRDIKDENIIIDTKTNKIEQVHIASGEEGPVYQTYYASDVYAPEQVHIAIGASPNSMTVMWSTANATKDSTVMYGQDGNTDKKTTGSAIKFTSSGTEKRFQYIHTVIISD